MHRLLSASAASSLLVLAACGGGGDNTPNTAPNNTAQPSGAINASNYVSVGSQTLSTSLSVADAGRVSGFSASTSPSDTSANSAATAGTFLKKAGKAQVEKALAQFGQTNLLRPAAVTQDSRSCSNGGTITVKLNDANNNNILDAGDSMSMQFSNCKEGGETINGQMSFALNQMTGTLGSSAFSFTASISFSNMSLSSASGSDSINGNASISIKSTSSNTETYDLDTPSLTVSSTSGGANFSATLSGFKIRETTTPAPGSTTATNTSTTVNGSVATSGLGTNSSALVETTSAFVQSSFNSYPTSGQMVVKGLNGSRVRVTAQANQMVLFELDADGNGVYEASQTRSWSQLM